LDVCNQSPASVRDLIYQSPRSTTAWAALRYFNLYRLSLSGLFVVLIVSGTAPPPIGGFDPELFSIGAFVYFLLAIGVQILVEKQWPVYGLHLLGQVVIDAVAITVMMYASGGITSGFGMLLIVSVAGASLLSEGRIAILFAAITSLAVLGEEAYRWTTLSFPVANYTHAGFLGATFFATALSAYLLGRRVRESEALADQRAIDLANLSRLNEHIIQRMQAGIVVLDGGGRLRLLNESAARLLGSDESAIGRQLGEVAPELEREYSSWMREKQDATRPLRSGSGPIEIIASFTGLGREAIEGTLIFLEDAAVTRQRAQQLKLASLGRLTGSIAHEIRNPLGAISHASQLLSESPQRSLEDVRLTRIIKEHSERVNSIIESILQIGRRESAIPESVRLRPWLESFCAELASRNRLDPGDLEVRVQPDDIVVRIDRGQLRQILWNLCENALRYSTGRPMLELQAAVNASTERPYLDVRDRGPGIAADDAEHIFEPFFTTTRQGSGLGLYIAGELCEANQASLVLQENSASGCVFRINFAHPERRQLSA
jgi:two-component system sensor histidine kinase PilS (NtrC family)